MLSALSAAAQDNGTSGADIEGSSEVGDAGFMDGVGNVVLDALDALALVFAALVGLNGSDTVSFLR